MRFVTVACSLTITVSVLGTNPVKNYTQSEYVAEWSSVAVENMKTYRIPASITLAQGILESGNGNSELARVANNHFGIKCHDWTGDKMYIDDDASNECFRKYPTADDSYKDHSLFLTGRSRYAKLFTLSQTDYKAWAQGLKDAGYATSPTYPTRLVELIEKLGLAQYDNPNAIVPDVYVQNSTPKNTETISAYSAHKVMKHKNKVDYIVARKGDTFYKIAKEFNMGMWQLYRYNDFGPKKDLLIEGDIVYLQPKRRRAKDKHATSFTANGTVTLTTISQCEGIKLESLMHMNNISSPDEIVPKGAKILLR